jgi:tetratricopeptide (TPR) repeat protein
MSIFSQLKINACAVALLVGAISSPSIASNELSQEPGLEGQPSLKNKTFGRLNALETDLQESEGNNILDYLPDEVLAHIFSFTPLKDTNNISSTCRRFHAVNDDTFKGVREFKTRFADIKEALQVHSQTSLDNLLEYHLEALKSFREATTHLARLSPDMRQELGKSIYDKVEQEEIYRYLFIPQDSTSLPSLFAMPSFKAATLGEALYNLWPELAVSTLLIPTEQHPFYQKKLMNLGGYEGHQARDIFALIHTTQELRTRFALNEVDCSARSEAALFNSKRHSLLASELMHRGAEARLPIHGKVQSYFRKNDPNTALTLLKPLVDLYPEDGPGPVINLIILYKTLERNYQEQHQDNIKFYTLKAVDMDPKGLPANTYFEAATTYHKKEQWAKAAANYKTALGKNPEFEGTVYLNAGISFLRSGQFKEAIVYLVEAKNRDAGLKANADAILGTIYLELGDKKQAQEFTRSFLNAGGLQKFSLDILRRYLKDFDLTEEYQEYLNP